MRASIENKVEGTNPNVLTHEASMITPMVNVE
jgi:hypothetical protein